MQNIQDNHDAGSSGLDSCSESSQGQSRGQKPEGQSTVPGNAPNMGNEAFVNNGQNIYQGTPQNSINQPGQSPQTSFTGQAGAQNANEVPHYTSEGYILGRPQEANNPQTAGNIQGSTQAPLPGGPQGAVFSNYQQVPPQMQPQMQPQYVYTQVPPNAQPQNFYQQNPAQPAFQQNPYNTQYAPYEQQSPQPKEQPSEGEKRHGQIIDVVNGIINGETPDIPKLINLFENIDTQFWKGAVIGAVLVFVATNDTVKKTIGDALSGIMGKTSGTENVKGENNV